ncbi:MAG: threonine aldolase [Thermoplasmata archaeon]|jgi:threonine aldolase|nr:threonine aldolase [Thermoplasmata archaeon]
MQGAPTRSFASDNNSGVHPRVMQALAEANRDHVLAYGDDAWTQRAEAKLREAFGADARAFFVFNGTGANVLGLAAMMRPWECVLTTEWAHLASDECAAPEKFLGSKVVTIRAPEGKLTPESVKPFVKGIGDQHHAQPRVISITQSTELGTVYRPEEIRALADFAHQRQMYLHVDGARLANAAAALGVPLRAITTDAGVDVLSLGGTKNGLMFGEAVVALRPELAKDMRFLRKQGMQLASKMRFVSAQFEALLTDDLWRESAGHANRMARLLADEASRVPGVKLARPCEANAVFPILPKPAADALLRDWLFYPWNEATGEYRWVCSFDTTEDDVKRFVSALRDAMTKHR